MNQTVRTTIDINLKKWALLNDVCFAEALRIGISVIKKRRDGLAGLMNREKEILGSIERLNSELEIIREEVKKLNKSKKLEEDIKKKDNEDEKLKETKKLAKSIRMNNPMRNRR